jgi:hypothetical protein
LEKAENRVLSSTCAGGVNIFSGAINSIASGSTSRAVMAERILPTLSSDLTLFVGTRVGTGALAMGTENAPIA